MSKKNLILLLTLWVHLSVFCQTDAIIDSLFKNSYKVFNQQRLSNGMYRDATLFDGTNYHPISISNTGMGLISLCIADAMGWVENAPDLAFKTLESVNGYTSGFSPDRTSNGFFRHFLDPSSGVQAWNSDYSTIDTGILIAGALFSKNYFQNDTLSNLVNELWNSVAFQAAIANSSTGKIFLSMNANGSGVSNSLTSPYSEYMIVAWLAKHSSEEANNPGELLWNNYYQTPSLLPNNIYRNHVILSDNQSSFLSSFTHQFNYYLCHYFTTNTEYLNYFKNAQLGDKAWWSNHTNNSFEWGLGAGNSVSTNYNYHADAINKNPDTIVSPHIIAGYIPVNPEGKYDLINIWNSNKGKYLLHSEPETPILWRYSKPYENWIPNGVIGIDYSSMLFGLSTLNEYLGKDFFIENNNFFSNETDFIPDEDSNTTNPQNEDDEVCQNIHLPKGWFIFSSYIEAHEVNVEGVMKPIIENLSIVKSHNGEVYLNEWEYNGIENLDLKNAYQIKMNHPDILEICGSSLDANEKKVILNPGWNTIPQLEEAPVTIDNLIGNLKNDNLIILKDYKGAAYFPSLNFDAIRLAQPGKGYQLKVNESDVLNYDNILSPTTTYESVIALKDMASFPIGMSIQSNNITNKTKYSKTLQKDFNSLSAEWEMKMKPIYKGPNQYGFSGGDAIVNYAKENGFRVHGHALIWHESIPIWLNNFSGSDEEFEDLIESYIKTTVTHFAEEKTMINGQEVSVVESWDVVNEAFTDGAENAVFRQRMGEGYVAKCFTWAREADPNAKLFYNDYNLEFDYNKVNQVIGMIDDFRSKGIPVDGIGLQTHINITFPPKERFEACLNLLLEKDVLIHFSEIDMTVNREKDISELTYDRAIEQEKKYKEITELYQTIPKEKQFGMTFWGMRDVESWLLNFYNNHLEFPLLYDTNFNCKVAHRGVLEGLHKK